MRAAVLLLFAFTTSLAALAQQRFDLKVREDMFAGMDGDPVAFDRAMKLIADTLAREPDHAEALVWRGDGRLFMAGQAFQRGDFAGGQKLFTEGLADMERAVALAPNDLRLWRNLGSALYWAPGERPKSEPAFKKVVELAEAEIKINPRQPALLAQLASAHSMLGSRAETVAAATAVERLGAADAETAYTVASAYEQIGDRAAALNWLQQSIAKGYSRDLIDRSPSLAELRKDPRYRTLVDKAVAR